MQLSESGCLILNLLIGRLFPRIHHAIVLMIVLFISHISFKIHVFLADSLSSSLELRGLEGQAPITDNDVGQIFLTFLYSRFQYHYYPFHDFEIIG